MVEAVPDRVLEKIIARIPVGRLGEAHEIARGVAFLVERRCRFHHRVDAVDQRWATHVLTVCRSKTGVDCLVRIVPCGSLQASPP